MSDVRIWVTAQKGQPPGVESQRSGDKPDAEDTLPLQTSTGDDGILTLRGHIRPSQFTLRRFKHHETQKKRAANLPAVPARI